MKTNMLFCNLRCTTNRVFANHNEKILTQINLTCLNYVRGISIVRGSFKYFTPKLKKYVDEKIDLCQPDNIHICDGSEEENKLMLRLLQSNGTIHALTKYENCWLARTNPADVARVESKTFLCTPDKWDSIPRTKENVTGQLGNWISPDKADDAILSRFSGCMKGRTMYVIPFSMGPIGSPLAKIGIQLTDSSYVVSSMKLMTRMGESVLKKLYNQNEDFVKALHSVGTPENGIHRYPSWPCDPDRTIIIHKLHENEIVSYGSSYGGNSLLGKKCFALRIGSYLAKKEGWLAEHMLILGVTNPEGKKRYIAAAFPSACGKTNLAMMTATLPGYKIECVGDDIAWMKFNERGELRAINPENGFFGVAPGTSNSTNPNAMETIFRNTIFTNTASTSDGGVYWEGLEQPPNGIQIVDWLGNEWTPNNSKSPAAHPNSRFCSPANQCPIIDKDWENPEGVKIDAILFGGRRPTGIPLVYESLNWKHGVFIGAAMRSETTAAAEYKAKVIMHDPFAMRPFFGYNFGKYLDHWLGMENRPNSQLPKIFHVNWFRKGEDGKYLWPGFGENSRVLDWIFRRIDNKTDSSSSSMARETAIGYVPTTNSIRLDGLKETVDLEQLFAIDVDFWKREIEEVSAYLEEQVGTDTPKPILEQIAIIKDRLLKL